MKRRFKKREQLFWFKKLTDISKQNTTFVKDVNAPTDCIGSRNTYNNNNNNNNNNCVIVITIPLSISVQENLRKKL
jgi:hypothetical protein